MSRHLFAVPFLLLLVMMCCTCGPAYAARFGDLPFQLFSPCYKILEANVTRPTNKTVKMNVTDEKNVTTLEDVTTLVNVTTLENVSVPCYIEMPGEENFAVTPLENFSDFRSPFLFGTGDVMVAFADGRYADDKCFTGFVTRQRNTGEWAWAEKLTMNNKSGWKTQIFNQIIDIGPEDKCSQRKYIAAVVKDSKIYVLVLIRKAQALVDMVKYVEEFKLIVGEVITLSDAKGNKTIEWGEYSVLDKLTKQFGNNNSFEGLTNYVGSGFLTEDGKIMFLMKDLNSSKEVVNLIHLNVIEKKIDGEFFLLTPAEGCSSLTVFEWSKKLFMVSYCPDGSKKVEELTDMGKTRTDVVWSIARAWDNLKDKGDFVTTTVDDTPLLLFTQPRGGIGTEVHWWLTDGKRVHRIGQVTTTLEPTTAVSYVFTKGEFFSLYKKNIITPYILLTDLKPSYQAIQTLLRNWAQKDEYFAKPCRETAPYTITEESLCATPFPTNGLVGWLSDKGNQAYWIDEFFFTNAMVRGGTKVYDGYTFKGANAGAQWTISKQGLEHRYDFARYGLTVAATVTIHEVPLTSVPVLTVDGLHEEENIGLWYSDNKTWKVISKDGMTTAGTWNTNETYRVTITLQNNSLLVYVDAKPLGDPLPLSLTEVSLSEITNIFIGAYEDDIAKPIVSNVTITNVLLYNWLFNANELNALSVKTYVLPRSRITGDSSLHVPVGSALLFLLGLWGLAALC